MHTVVSYCKSGRHKRKEKRDGVRKKLKKSSESNSVTKQPSIGGKDLHRHGLNHLLEVRSPSTWSQVHDNPE
jgi:hypothetical protein